MQMGHLRKTMPDGSEARCVGQEVANTGPASPLGLSSKTPSAEALRALLAMAGADDLRVCGLDVSAAFRFSPLPGRARAIVKLLPDVSYYILIIASRSVLTWLKR